MRYTISRGSAHSSFSLDVGVVATPIPHSNPISPYATGGKAIVWVWPQYPHRNATNLTRSSSQLSLTNRMHDMANVLQTKVDDQWGWMKMQDMQAVLYEGLYYT